MSQENKPDAGVGTSQIDNTKLPDIYAKTNKSAGFSDEIFGAKEVKMNV